MKPIQSYLSFLAMSCTLLPSFTEASNSAFPFLKINENKIVRKTQYASRSTPKSQILQPGLMFQCKCSNKKCSNQTQFLLHVGMGTHNIAQYLFKFSQTESFGEKNKSVCPTCKAPPQMKDITTIKFFDCSYTIDGAYITSQKDYFAATTFKERKQHTKIFEVKQQTVASGYCDSYKTEEEAWWVFLTIVACKIAKTT